MILSQAIEALTPALTVTPRFAVVTAVIAEGHLTAYNGEILGQAPIDLDVEVMLNAERLQKVWRDNSRMSIGEKRVTIKSGRTEFRLNRLFDEPPRPPLVTEQPEIKLTNIQRQAILLAAKFASLNAIHPWACGVGVTRHGLIATNNQVLVRIPCEFEWELTLPFWAVNLLNRDTSLPTMSVDERMIKFTWEDGVILQAQRLSADFPVQVFGLAEHLTEEATDPVDLSLVLEEADKLENHLCRLGPEGLVIETRDAEQAVVADARFSGEFQLSMATAKLVFEHATHISFADAPERLRFSKSTEPKLIGFAAGMR